MENVVAISIMVVGGVLLAIIVSAICGNRKLRRHKECCRKDPHVPGMETNKTLRVEIERRVERVGDIKYEPLLLSPDLPAPKHEQDQYYNRMKALDHLCYLERELSRLPGVTPRLPHETLRGFLLRLTVGGGSGSAPTGGAVLRGLEPRLLHQLCDQHAHARYHPQAFTRHNLTHTHALMLRVLHCGRSGGAKGLGSDDHLKAPSDHDSAIDADPIELEPSDDERSLRHQQQQQQQQHHHYQRQQHKQQQCLTTTEDSSSYARGGSQQYTSQLCPTDRSSLLVGGGSGGGGTGGGKQSFFSPHTFPPAPSKSGVGVSAALGYPSPGSYPNEPPGAVITSTGSSTGYRHSEGGRTEGGSAAGRRETKLRKPKKRPGHLKIQDEEES